VNDVFISSLLWLPGREGDTSLSRRMNRKVFFDKEPPFFTLRETLRRMGYPVPPKAMAPVKFVPNALEEFRTAMWDDLEARPVGNQRDLEGIWTHTMGARDRVLIMVDDINARRGSLTRRQNFAQINVQAGAQTLEVALLLHTAADVWYSYTVLSQCRIALELAAKGAFLALGTNDEPGRWFSAHTVKEKSKRRTMQIKMGECLLALDPFVATREPTAATPSKVYEWLCSYTHFGAEVVLRPGTHVKAYAGLAYTGWLLAVVAEIVSGLPPFAKWPLRWPNPLPW
jgi:hypothetical protein